MEVNVNKERGEIEFYIETKDRGPRQDHGGPSGDGWMGSEELADVSAPYRKKYYPKLDDIKNEIKIDGFETKAWFDYGEKGHISLGVTFKKISRDEER